MSYQRVSQPTWGALQHICGIQWLRCIVGRQVLKTKMTEKRKEKKGSVSVPALLIVGNNGNLIIRDIHTLSSDSSCSCISLDTFLSCVIQPGKRSKTGGR